MKAMHQALIALAAYAAFGPLAAQGAGFADVLDTPALASPLAAKGLLQAVARAGDRLVAVGQRGHVVYSTDGGGAWKQGSVPVSADLTGVFFVGDKQGWAVGHDGVILATADGGATWTTQLDGRKGNQLTLAAMERKAAAEPASEDAKALLAEAKRNVELGADKPLLDVWFADANNGYAVGAFNLIFHTTDGGKSWVPLVDRTENPGFLSLYAIRPAGGELYIAGEAGLVLKLDRATQRFRALSLPYKGTLFGLVDAESAVVVFGLRGNVFRSTDGGKTWAKVEAGLPATIASGTTIGKGSIVLADVGGRLAASSDGGKEYKPMPLKPPMPVTGLTDAGNGRLALVGPRGVAVAEVTVP
jgi:photosystem II stability/assembly factor-like uncharacterized protein